MLLLPLTTRWEHHLIPVWEKALNYIKIKREMKYEIISQATGLNILRKTITYCSHLVVTGGNYMT